jgi:hypothetical protein
MRWKTYITVLFTLAALALSSVAAAALIRGTPHDDRLVGTPAADQIYGLAGDDEIRGKEGPDRIDGGPGADTMYAGAGADRQHGGPGADTLWAVARDGDVDYLDCGPGRDVAHIREGERSVVENCERVVVEPDATTPTAEPGD